jgi:hypothetical protein
MLDRIEERVPGTRHLTKRQRSSIRSASRERAETAVFLEKSIWSAREPRRNRTFNPQIKRPPEPSK